MGIFFFILMFFFWCIDGKMPLVLELINVDRVCLVPIMIVSFDVPKRN